MNTRKILAMLLSLVMVIGLMTPAAMAVDVAVSSQDELNTAVANAESGSTITLAAGNYTLPGFSGKELTFKGVDKENTSINDYVATGSQSMNGSTVHFEDLTVNGATENYKGLYHTNEVTYKNCNINGLRFLYAPTVSFEYCVFNSTGEHSFWTYGAENVTVTDCEFTYADRAVNCYGDSGEFTTNIAFSNCSFTYNGSSETPEGAVEINSDALRPINATFTGCDAPNKGAMWFNSKWDTEKGAHTTVEVDDEDVWPVYEAAIGETKYSTLANAFTAAQDGDTVTLLTDVALDWDDTVRTTTSNYPVLVCVEDKAITLDLNGKTITVDHQSTTDRIYAVVCVADGASLTVTGNGGIDVDVNDTNPKVVYMFWKRGTTGTLTIENGTYHMDNSEDSMVYTNGDEIVTVEGGTFTLDKVGTRENRFPCIFNVSGAGDYNVIVTGGTFNDDISHQHWINEVEVPNTHYMQKNSDDTWTVKSGAVAYVNNVVLTGPFDLRMDFGYATLEEAIVAADDADDPITLLQDVTLSASVDVSGTDFYQNDKTITLAAGITFTSGNDLDVANFRTVAGYKVVETESNGIYTYTSVYAPVSSGSSSDPSYQVKNEVEGLKSSHRTAEAGETVTLTVKDGYDISDIVVIDKKGNEVDVTYKNGKYTFKMPKGGVTVTAVDNTDVFRFEDVDDGFWAEDEIYWAYEEGLMNGTSATTFNPNGKVTRQQVWMILARMAGYAPEDMSAAKGWAVSTGVSDGSNPGNPVTRQQLVTLIWRAEGEPEGDLSVLADYPDAASVAAYAQEAMAWAIENSVIGGTAQGTLNPQGNANRAQLAVILYRYIG